MIKSVILDPNDLLVFASTHANISRTIKELKAEARKTYFHPNDIREVMYAKKVLDAINNRDYVESSDEPNTVYLNI